MIDVDRFMMLRYDGSNWVELFPGTQRFGEIAYLIDGGGTLVSSGEKININIPIEFDCEILAVRAGASQSGTIEIDEWVDSYANYPPTVGDSIVASAPISLSAADKYEDTTLTNWITRLNRGDWLRPDVAATPAPVSIQAVTIVHEITIL